MINVNEYFGGNVKSLGFENKQGKFTAGVMVPGEYEFNTSSLELISVISGSLTVKLPGNADFQTFNTGETFIVEANKKFQLQVSEPSSYLCKYE
jgi:uncharacterized protein YaiE (UPF0345 family)